MAVSAERAIPGMMEEERDDADVEGEDGDVGLEVLDSFDLSFCSLGGGEETVENDANGQGNEGVEERHVFSFFF